MNNFNIAALNSEGEIGKISLPWLYKLRKI